MAMASAPRAMPRWTDAAVNPAPSMPAGTSTFASATAAGSCVGQGPGDREAEGHLGTVDGRRRLDGQRHAAELEAVADVVAEVRPVDDGGRDPVEALGAGSGVDHDGLGADREGHVAVVVAGAHRCGEEGGRDAVDGDLEGVFGLAEHVAFK